MKATTLMHPFDLEQSLAELLRRVDEMSHALTTLHVAVNDRLPGNLATDVQLRDLSNHVAHAGNAIAEVLQSVNNRSLPTPTVETRFFELANKIIEIGNAVAEARMSIESRSLPTPTIETRFVELSNQISDLGNSVAEARLSITSRSLPTPALETRFGELTNRASDVFTLLSTLRSSITPPNILDARFAELSSSMDHLSQRIDQLISRSSDGHVAPDGTDKLSQPEHLMWTPALVAQFWNGMAQAGLDDVAAFGRMAKRCIYWLISRHLTPGGRHLDYGAGGGEIADYLIKHGFPFAIYEPSCQRLQKAEHGMSSASGFLGIEKSPASESYDVVTCFEVLEHVLDCDFDRVCDELVGHVRPGGRLVVTTPNNEDLQASMVYCPVSNTVFHKKQHVRRLSPTMITEVFAKRGLRKVCVHQIDLHEDLFSPYLHLMGFREGDDVAAEATSGAIPTHIDQIIRDTDSAAGARSRLIYIGMKPDSPRDKR